MSVRVYRKASRSAKLLKTRLDEAGYRGPDIHWGLMKMNKREALFTMQTAGVPTPWVRLPPIVEEHWFPCVGRRDFHAHQSGMFICKDWKDYQRTRRFKRPPTHYLEWIDPPLREFRVHVAFGKVLKLMDRATGWFPGSGPAPEFNHKETLRQTALDAVEALEMDFGAVDILWTEEKGFMVLEVNSGPDLKNPTTLEKYVEAFMAEYF